MVDNDIKTGWRDFRVRDIQLAFALLTRLPLPQIQFDPASTRPAAHGAWAYPLVGVATAAILALTALVLRELGASATIAAGVAVLAVILATGALHEDGLADCADGFWGGWTPERRLEIMKDSQIGAYGVLALILIVGLRWMVVAELIVQGTLLFAAMAAAVTSRGAMVWVMATLPQARRNGLSDQTGVPPRAAVLAAAGLAVLLSALAVGHAVFLVAAVAGLTGLGLMRLARKKIGGQTGDVLGSTQQIIELSLLLCLSMAL